MQSAMEPGEAVSSLEVFVPGVFVGKGRPRLGQGGHVYTPAVTAEQERTIGWAAKEAIAKKDGAWSLTGPMSLRAWFTLPIPASWSKKRKAAPGPHTSKPDLDNLLKLLDSCNGILWEDDAQLVILSVGKSYGEQPGLELKVRHQEHESP